MDLESIGEIHGPKTLHEHQLLNNKSEDDILSDFLRYASSANSNLKHTHFNEFKQRTSPNEIRIQQLGQHMEALLNHDLETMPPTPTHNTRLDTSSDWGSQSPI